VCVRVGCSGGLLTPSPPAEKTTARQDQAGKPCANYWTGNAVQVAEPNNRVDGRVGATEVDVTVTDNSNVADDDVIATRGPTLERFLLRLRVSFRVWLP
jgi:hypothetical protein